MKAKRIIVYISTALITISIIIIVVSFLFKSKLLTTIFGSIGFGIFSSSIVTLLSSIGEYYTSRKETLEKYYDEIYNIIKSFDTIIYINCNKESELLLAYNEEFKSNQLWSDVLSTNINQKTKAKSALIDYYITDTDWITNDITNEQIDAIIQCRLNMLIKKLEKSMNSYIELSNHSLNRLESIYGDFGFLTHRGTSEYRDWIYNNLHSVIRDNLNRIREKSFHFKLYMNREANNLTMMYNMLKELNKCYFEKQEQIDKEIGVKNILVVQAFLTQLNQAFYNLYCKIYKKKEETVEPYILSGETIFLKNMQ